MEGLPPEIYVHILSFLGAKDVISFCAADKFRRKLGAEHSKLLLRPVECDGELVAEKLGGLYVPNNEPLEKEKEEMKAKFFVTPFAVPEGKVEFEGEYDSQCFWHVQKGMLHGPFRCVMETAYDYALIEEGTFRRGKLHGEVVSYKEYEPGHETTTLWHKGTKKRKHVVLKGSVCVKEYRTLRRRKTREKYSVVKKEFYRKQNHSWYRCSGKEWKAWSRCSETRVSGNLLNRYCCDWDGGESWWSLENSSGVVSEKTQKSFVCLSGRCCQMHGEHLGSVISGDVEFDYDDVFYG
ncbi:hypothetical protein [Brazilian marseillevirus]|uniref:hypothetical protein n=1 Tax=Brazilian marseillevirus TaxID=1813599 RepID=UPI000784F65D|nr:hypothetical protein A3303_gp036 [Brazilian marseillevirus]AMQ10544.1 hypothetical protein [Brazilian marseillevirus]